MQNVNNPSIHIQAENHQSKSEPRGGDRQKRYNYTSLYIPPCSRPKIHGPEFRGHRIPPAVKPLYKLSTFLNCHIHTIFSMRNSGPCIFGLRPVSVFHRMRFYRKACQNFISDLTDNVGRAISSYNGIKKN